ncbi:protein of unknown function [Candidatus Methylomirabilis oxygeniifera]|uniref:Uncharacterized protein n=1 Tax=Methylomirabilis oxygeniifera TaxID=671143 RepID=D5MH68_METO1|nr:protein of unknown function [Candidatus Methylomirabilis oxyfera]
MLNVCPQGLPLPWEPIAAWLRGVWRQGGSPGHLVIETGYDALQGQIGLRLRRDVNLSLGEIPTTRHARILFLCAKQQRIEPSGRCVAFSLHGCQCKNDPY